MAVPAAANAGVGPNAGDPLLFGRGACPAMGMAGVAANSYTPPTGNPTGSIGVFFDGVFFLSDRAADAPTGGSNVQINPGDKVYADGGTYDITTGCLYGFTLTTNATTGAYFGNALDMIAAGVTDVIRVRLKQSGG
jgi:hypothetical protein